MKKKVLVLDIDGTLTNSRKEISPATLEAIGKLQRRGHIVVLASGRPTAGLRAISEKLHFAENGGFATTASNFISPCCGFSSESPCFMSN